MFNDTKQNVVASLTTSVLFGGTEQTWARGRGRRRMSEGSTAELKAHREGRKRAHEWSWASGCSEHVASLSR